MPKIKDFGGSQDGGPGGPKTGGFGAPGPKDQKWAAEPEKNDQPNKRKMRRSELSKMEHGREWRSHLSARRFWTPKTTSSQDSKFRVPQVKCSDGSTTAQDKKLPTRGGGSFLSPTGSHGNREPKIGAAYFGFPGVVVHGVRMA